MPLRDRPDAADDRFYVQHSGGEKANHALPDRPVVAEAAAERDVFLHERIEGETERLMSPAHFADPAVGADDLKRALEGRGNAGGIDRAIDAEAITLLRPFLQAFDD